MEMFIELTGEDGEVTTCHVHYSLAQMVGHGSVLILKDGSWNISKLNSHILESKIN